MIDTGPRHFRAATAQEIEDNPQCLHCAPDRCTAPTRCVDYNPGLPGTELYFCEEHAAFHRRLEVEDWLLDLQSLDGARVIPVRDLGAALEAREIALDGVEYVSGEYRSPFGGQFGSSHGYGRRRIRHAVRLARVALGIPTDGAGRALGVSS